MLSEKGISKLLDAKNPDELKLWADKVYQLLTAIKQLTIPEIPEAATVTVQRGTITIASGNTSGTATISAVDMAKAELRMLGFTTDYTGTGPYIWAVKLVFTNSTTVTATRNTSTANDAIVSFEVTETT